jgi:2,3-diketo-5-methylthio-1-phosphopentane phosphatase
MNYSAILLDIEGTITPVAFVYDTLFPYAHDHLARFLEDNWDEQDVQSDIDLLRKQIDEDREAGQTDVVDVPYPGQAPDKAIREAAVKAFHQMMHADRKVTALKSLQGKIWRDGYERGQLTGEFYDDAIRALARWNANDITIAIYSSGSVEAQQLLFQHSEEGDLRPFVSKWFDTKTGGKRDMASYRKIARSLEVEPGDVLFATDVVEEANAAHQAGMQVLIMERLGNMRQPEHEFRSEQDFEMV